MDDNQQDDAKKDDLQTASLEGPVETIASPEISEKEPVYENPVAPVSEAVKEAEKVQVATPVVESPAANVVDMRSSNEKTRSVSQDAQKLTKAADEEEKDFIEHVDGIHSIKP